jgi:hypothetical protein
VQERDDRLQYSFVHTSVTFARSFGNVCLFALLFRFEYADLEWKLIYIGSAEDEKYDQVLESVLVGPVNVGNYRFIFQVCILRHSSSFFHYQWKYEHSRGIAVINKVNSVSSKRCCKH